MSPSNKKKGYAESRIPLNTLYRWYMYDLDYTNPNDYVDVFDLTPVSEEGDEKERQDAERRIANVEPLLSFIQLYSNINAQYMFELQKPEFLKMTGKTEEDLGKEITTMKKLYYQLTLGGLMAAFSSAIELGIISTDGSETEVG